VKLIGKKVFQQVVFKIKEGIMIKETLREVLIIGNYMNLY
jgi:hypothetical protein